MPIALICADVATLVELVLRSRPSGSEPGITRWSSRNPAGRFPELGGGATIGVRVPDLPDATAEVVRAVGAVAATSANIHGGGDPCCLDDIPAVIRAAARSRSTAESAGSGVDRRRPERVGAARPAPGRPLGSSH
jgi:hypothetical protein